MATIKLSIPFSELDGLSLKEQYDKFAELLYAMVVDDTEEGWKESYNYITVHSGYSVKRPDNFEELGFQGSQKKQESL